MSAVIRCGGGCAPLLPLPPNAVRTLEALVNAHEHGGLRVSPFCHEFANQVRGWVLDVPADAGAAVLPMPYNLFHGVSVVLCEATEAEVLQLMQHPADTRRRLGRALEDTMRMVVEGDEERATWARCRPGMADGVPRSLYGAMCTQEGEVVFVPDPGHSEHPIIDSEPWDPELSPDGFVGLYLRWQGGAYARACAYAFLKKTLTRAHA